MLTTQTSSIPLPTRTPDPEARRQPRPRKRGAVCSGLGRKARPNDLAEAAGGGKAIDHPLGGPRHDAVNADGVGDHTYESPAFGRGLHLHTSPMHTPHPSANNLLFPAAGHRWAFDSNNHCALPECEPPPALHACSAKRDAAVALFGGVRPTRLAARTEVWSLHKTPPETMQCIAQTGHGEPDNRQADGSATTHGPEVRVAIPGLTLHAP